MKRTKNGGIDKRYGLGRKTRTPLPSRVRSKVQQELFLAMVEQGLTLKSVAQRMGRHPVSLSYWKAGKHEMRSLDLEDMAEVLGYRLVMVKL